MNETHWFCARVVEPDRVFEMTLVGYTRHPAVAGRIVWRTKARLITKVPVDIMFNDIRSRRVTGGIRLALDQLKSLGEVTFG